MRRGILISILFVCARAAAAQTVVDGSGDKLASEDLARLLAQTSKKLPSPQSAQFRNIRKAAEKVYCGEVSGKDSAGTDTGFKPFVADLADNGYVSILPSPDATFYATIVIDLKVYRCIPQD